MRINLFSERRRIPAGRDRGGGGGEHVPPVEGRRHPVRDSQRHRGAHSPEHVGRGRQQPVVRADEHAPRGGDDQRPPGGADPRVDDREMYRGRQVTDRLGEHDRPPPYVTGGHQMADVDDPHAGRVP